MAPEATNLEDREAMQMLRNTFHKPKPPKKIEAEIWLLFSDTLFIGRCCVVRALHARAGAG